ncbi:MAG: 30S ribosomal protein S19e [Candidatus Aenigmatarchaeota archaeon]
MDARSKDPQKLVNAVSVKLSESKEFEPPQWSKFVKTGAAKVRNPDDQNWWFVRTASILRRIYIDGPGGTSRLRTVYGSRKKRGTARERTYRGSGSIIRKILQQLEKSGMVKKTEKPKKGRTITPKGQKFIESVAKTV